MSSNASYFRRALLAARSLLAINVGVSVAMLDAAEPSRRGPSAAEEKVEQILRGEYEAATSAESLKTLLKDSPDFAPAHWANGDVLRDGKWESFEETSQKVRESQSWQKYREMRREADMTVKSQMALADFCRRQRLFEQERAHLEAVVVLDPKHAVARGRLGQVKVEDEWVSKAGLEDRKAHSRAVTAALKKYRAELGRMNDDLKKKTLSPGDVVAALSEMTTPECIPALETFLSTPSEAGALCVVSALSRRSEPDASISLARHALYYPSSEVREAAAAALEPRDPQGYIPFLITALQEGDRFGNASEQRVLRQFVVVEKGNKQEIAVLDKVFHYRPNGTPKPASVAKTNPISRLLERVTGEKDCDTAGQWWSWWNDQNEVYQLPSDSKKKESGISYSRMDVFVELPPPAPPGAERKECLAPGTLVWTDSGPMAIDRIRMGDLVLSQHPETGELAYKVVLKPTDRPPEILLRVQIGGDAIRTTGGHPFWVSGQGWVKARALKTGMPLHTVRGAIPIDDIQVEDEPVKAFNLVVADYHTYFVGKHFVLSHDNTVRNAVTVPVPGLKPQRVAASATKE